MNTRIAGYDLARSLAVFGLVVANFSHSVDHIDLYWLHTHIQGGATATFLVLGGIGVSLLTQRARITDAAHKSADSRKRLIKRAASLLVVGICCNLIWQANFLCFYSICIAIGALLLTASNRWLWSLAFVFAVMFAVFLSIFKYKVGWNWDTLWKGDPWTIEVILFRAFLYRFHLIFYWITFLLIGMWLGRRNVHHFRVRGVVFFGGIAVALIPACTSWLLIHYVPWLISGWHPSVSDLFSKAIGMLFTPVYLLGICGIATAIIGGSLMLTQKYPDAKWTRPFIATGQLALTLYVAHLIIGRGILKALGVLDKTLPLAIGSAVIFCICAVVFSHFWRKRYDRGPLEWGMRRITG